MKPDARSRRWAKKIVDGIEEQHFIGLKQARLQYTDDQEDIQRLKAAFDEEGVDMNVVKGEGARRLLAATRDSLDLEMCKP